MTESIRARVHKALNPQPEAEFNADPGACRALGCPCRGTIDLGSSGRFYCAWHARTDGDKWPALTAALHSHQWLIDHIGEMQRLHSEAGTGKPWLAAADSFWRDQPELKPQGHERTTWGFYLWRLREELAYRVGARKEPPEPRVPLAMTKAHAVRVIESAKAGEFVPAGDMTAALQASGDIAPGVFDDEVPWGDEALFHRPTARAHLEPRA
jgi:hypothetical protein